MSDIKVYIENNKKLWNELLDIHINAPMYDVDGFKAGKTSLDHIALGEVGDVQGKRLLHLLCRFGLDTLSWARLGAEVTGVDISDKAVATARALAEDCKIPARFVCCEAFEAPQHIDEKFDIVFMSWGAFCWISDFPVLARMVADFLAPGGVFYALEGHPLFMALNGKWRPEDGPLTLVDDYQSGSQPACYRWGPDYADPSKRPAHQQAFEWAHGLGRVVTSLIQAGLVIEFLHEHELAAYRGLEGLEPREGGFWALPEGVPQVPLSFSVKAVKRPMAGSPGSS